MTTKLLPTLAALPVLLAQVALASSAQAQASEVPKTAFVNDYYSLVASGGVIPEVVVTSWESLASFVNGPDLGAPTRQEAAELPASSSSLDRLFQLSETEPGTKRAARPAKPARSSPGDASHPAE